MPSDECAHRHSLPALELQVGDVIPNGRPTRRLEKRQLAVDGLRGRYCELVSSAVLDQLLPNPGDDIPKREWERRMFAARHLLLNSVFGI